MPHSSTPSRAGSEKAAGLPQLNVSLAESEYREQRQNHTRLHQSSRQSLLGATGPLPSPLSPTFSRDDTPRSMAAAAVSGPPPPYMPPSSPTSPAYSQTSFAAADPAQKQRLLAADEAPRMPGSPYLSPYGGSPGQTGALGAAPAYANSTEWIPMQRPLPPLGSVTAAQSRRRRRLRIAAFCLTPILLIIVMAVLGFVLGYQRMGKPQA